MTRSTGPVQVEDRPLREQRGHLAGEPAGARRLLHDDDLPVRATDSSTASSSSGFSERRSSTSTDASPSSASAARSQSGTIAPQATSVTSVPGRATRASPSGDDVLALGHGAARGAVDELRLEHDDRIGVADRRSEQALCVGRRRRDDDLHAGVCT